LKAQRRPHVEPHLPTQAKQPAKLSGRTRTCVRRGGACAGPYRHLARHGENPDTKQELRTVIKIASSKGNPILGNFYSIDQTYLVFPATITVQGSTVKMNIPGIAATYEGKLSADGNKMTGTVKGFSVPTPWNMTRVSEAEAWAIPKPPTPPRPMAADADPAFDVATIKPSNPDTMQSSLRVQDSNIAIQYVTFAELFRQVYEIHPNQVIGLPSWTSSERFDIAGKPDVPGQPNTDQLKVMVRKLLVSRFQLAFHTEQRELPAFSLNLAKGGAKIAENKEKSENTGVIFRGPGSFLLNNLNMNEFARMLQNSAVDRPVVNQTGLAGKYTFSLVWTPDNALTALPKSQPPGRCRPRRYPARSLRRHPAATGLEA
jgi:uncharacterized protein (TIGR03435 family)